MSNKQLIAVIAGIGIVIVAVVIVVVLQRSSVETEPTGRTPADSQTQTPPVAGGNNTIDRIQESIDQAVCGNGSCELGENYLVCQADCRPPVISGVDLGADHVKIRLNTEAVNDVTVEYGIQGGVDRTAVEAVNGEVNLTGLEPRTVYDYTIMGKDADGNDLPPITREFRTPAS